MTSAAAFQLIFGLFPLSSLFPHPQPVLLRWAAADQPFWQFQPPTLARPALAEEAPATLETVQRTRSLSQSVTDVEIQDQMSSNSCVTA